MVSTSSGADVRARVWGPPAPAVAPGLLLVHGFLGSWEGWAPLVARLPEGWRVVAVDLPGHGRELSEAGGGPTAGYTIPGVARLLGEVQERLLSRPAWWLGYSMGGRIALSAAVQGVPQKGLLLESASVGISGEAEREARRVADGERAGRLEALARESPRARGAGMEAFVKEWLALPLFAGLGELPVEVRERALRIRAAQDPARMAAWLRQGGAGVQPWYGYDLDRIRQPVHALVGERDRKYVALWTGLEQRVTNVRCTVVPGSGHVPHLENPGAWVSWVREALP